MLNQNAELHTNSKNSLSPLLDELTRHRVLDSLVTIEGSLKGAEDLWMRCCREADSPIIPTSFEDLERIANVFISLDGPLSLIGSSLSIRINTYRLLEKTQHLEAFLNKEEGS